MKIIRLHHPLDPQRHFKGPIVLAMGFFDGLHLGHYHVIMTAKRIAQRKHLPLAVLTYNHRPSLLYRRFDLSQQNYLTLNYDKFQILQRWGVQLIYVIDYTSSFQAQTPQEFVDNYLVRFHASVVVAGFDHTYGPRKIANMRLLPKYVRGRMQVVTVPDYKIDHRKVSSTRIRHALQAGRIKSANQLLGRPFTTHGFVVRGYQRGRKLGFPTVNIKHSEYQQLPARGVYITKVRLNRRNYAGMASIGSNPTFGHHPVTVEINLLHFHQNAYGEPVTVQWLNRLRGQIKFDRVYDLVLQMRKDRQVTQDYFKSD